MRPITVSVGPLAAANSTLIGAVQGPLTVGGTQLRLNGVGVTTSWAGTASITAGVLTVTATTSGAVTSGMRLNSAGALANTIVQGPAPGSVGNTWIVYPTQTVASRAMQGNPVATLDAPRQVVITNTEAAGNSFTVYGTDAAGSPITETLATNGAALTTQQNFATVTQITIANPSAAVVSAGTGAGTSPWVMFDPWASSQVSEQMVVSGAANYTVQISDDDPNSPTNPVPPGSMSWFPDPNAALVGASTNQFATWPIAPLWARILLNSGAGSVTGTFVQSGAVTR